MIEANWGRVVTVISDTARVGGDAHGRVLGGQGRRGRLLSLGRA